MTANKSNLAELPDILTAREAAKILRISLNKVYDALRKGDIPSVRMGQRYLIPKHRLAEAIGVPETPSVTAQPNEAVKDADPVDDFCEALARLLRHLTGNK